MSRGYSFIVRVRPLQARHHLWPWGAIFSLKEVEIAIKGVVGELSLVSTTLRSRRPARQIQPWELGIVAFPTQIINIYNPYPIYETHVRINLALSNPSSLIYLSQSHPRVEG